MRVAYIPLVFRSSVSGNCIWMTPFSSVILVGLREADSAKRRAKGARQTTRTDNAVDGESVVRDILASGWMDGAGLESRAARRVIVYERCAYFICTI